MQFKNETVSPKIVSVPSTVPSIAEQRKGERPYFGHDKMLPPTYKYVCWLDVMGSQSVMLRSLNMSAHFLMKLHLAALRAYEEPMELYPVIDGMYVCSSSQNSILNFLNRVYSALAVTFILETNPLYRFMVRSGLAYGPVVTGKETMECADELQKYPNHTKQVFFGPPLTQAYQIEKQSAPFGIALHDSVRTFAPNGETVLSGNYWKWWKIHCRTDDDKLAASLSASLKDHYEWCLKHTIALSYQEADIQRHKAIVEEYFSD